MPNHTWASSCAGRRHFRHNLPQRYFTMDLAVSDVCIRWYVCTSWCSSSCPPALRRVRRHSLGPLEGPAVQRPVGDHTCSCFVRPISDSGACEPIGAMVLADDVNGLCLARTDTGSQRIGTATCLCTMFASAKATSGVIAAPRVRLARSVDYWPDDRHASLPCKDATHSEVLRACSHRERKTDKQMGTQRIRSTSSESEIVNLSCTMRQSYT